MRYLLNEGYELENFYEANNMEDVLLIDNNSNRVIILNFTCAFIVNCLTREKRKDELIQLIQSKFECSTEEIEKDVNEILNLLLKENILCEV